ncbi:hypothetical protein ACFX1X_045652 [Malus domestica]
MISSRGESSMPSNDDHKPSIDADWRSFRAKLVAAEKSRPKEPTSASSLVDLHTVVDQPNPITVGDKMGSHNPQVQKSLVFNLNVFYEQFENYYNFFTWS